MHAKYRLAVLAAVGLLLLGIGSGAAKSDEETIRESDAQWSKSAQNTDAAKFATFYAETGSALPFNAPMVTGKAKSAGTVDQPDGEAGFCAAF